MQIWSVLITHATFTLRYKWGFSALLKLDSIFSITTQAAALLSQHQDLNIFLIAKTVQQLLLELLAWQVDTTEKHGLPKVPPMRTYILRMLSLTWMTKKIFIEPHWKGNLPKRGPFGWERALSKEHMVLKRWRKVREVIKMSMSCIQLKMSLT